MRGAYAGFGWRALALTAVVALAASALLAFSRPVVMTVDGERVDLDVSPVTAADKAFVPLRSVADALGAQTQWSPREQRILVTRGGRVLALRIGSEHATLDGMPMTLAHAPFRVRGRVLVPLGAVAQALGVQARYDRRTSRIDVVTPGIGEAPHPRPS